MQNIKLLKSINRFLSSISLVVFILLIAGIVAYSTYAFNNIAENPPQEEQTAAPTTLFDQATISKLNRLETSRKNANYQTLPEGRINPFSE